MTTKRWDHVVRCAHFADTTALDSLITESVSVKEGSAGISDTQQIGDKHRLTRAELQDRNIVTLVAETVAVADDALQGLVQVRWNVRPPSAGFMSGAVELRRHYVRMRHRGAGVAAGLLEAAVELARARDATGLWLKVGKDAVQAVAFYQKYGFQIAGSSIATEDPQWRERWVMHRVLHARATSQPATLARTAHFSLR